MARLHYLLPRAFALSRSLSKTKRPPTFIQGDRLLPEEIKPWQGSGTVPIRVGPQGLGILQDPLSNKGTSFPIGERDRLGLRGLLPPRVIDFKTQQTKVLEHVRSLPTDMDRHLYLTTLHDNNETLFFRVLLDNIEELAPVVYTPTVGDACQEFGFRFRRARGMYLSSEDKGQMFAAMANWPAQDVHVIVVTDGSRILGLGDLGAYGMGIPIGKLALYCAAGGIAPHRVLPVMLDAGTDNPYLLEDPYYIGLQHKRLRGEEYFALVDEFMDAVRWRYPTAFVQFEDFGADVAHEMLEYYRRQETITRKPMCVFNDDIQGTGAVTLAGVMSGLVTMGGVPEDLKDQRILLAGAGGAGIGVASMLVRGMMNQGLTEEEALQRFCLVDKDGLLAEPAAKRFLNDTQRRFLRTDLPDGLSLIETARAFRPTLLIGLSAQAGLFSEELIREMGRINRRPFIFPLSNPTSKAECTAEQAYEWTDDRAVFASGSPFDPVPRPDGRTLYPSQCNNMYIFPGLGLAVSVCKAIQVSDAMLYAASVSVSKAATAQDRAEGRIFPQVRDIRRVSLEVACAVIEVAIKEGLSRALGPQDLPNLKAIVSKKMYDPNYAPLIHRSLFNK